MRVLFVENQDSFSWNLLDCLPVARANVQVVDAAFAMVELETAQLVVIGPGPRDPQRAGLLDLVAHAARRRIPTLGVCLGHQALGLAFGARLVRSVPTHGKTGRATFTPHRLLPGVSGTYEVMRYHSLSVRDVGAPLAVVATLEDGSVMAVAHEQLPMVGLQFHPDSYGTPRGRELVAACFNGLLAC